MCKAGTGAAACGRGGAACEACGAPQACSAQACTQDAWVTMKYDRRVQTSYACPDIFYEVRSCSVTQKVAQSRVAGILSAYPLCAPSGSGAFFTIDCGGKCTQSQSSCSRSGIYYNYTVTTCADVKNAATYACDWYAP